MRATLLQTKAKEHKEKDKDKESNKDMLAALKEEEMEEIDQKDDGYIELVLRVLARMCDGQHCGLQVTYLSQLSFSIKYVIPWVTRWSVMRQLQKPIFSISKLVFSMPLDLNVNFWRLFGLFYGTFCIVEQTCRFLFKSVVTYP
jgi:hypothetical protein